MNRLLVVQNITREGLGSLEPVLEERGIGYDLVDLDKGAEFPSASDYGAVIVLGGPDSANRTNPKMTNEVLRVKAALDARIPYLGICLGMQVGVKAAGGEVVLSEHREIGFLDPKGMPYTVQLTEDGRKDPLFKGLGDELRVFHLHGETVELTPEMKLLATGTWCLNQVVKFGDNAYGIQSHFEQTEPMLRELAAVDPDLIPFGPRAILDEYLKIEAEYSRTGRTLFNNFLDIAGL